MAFKRCMNYEEFIELPDKEMKKGLQPLVSKALKDGTRYVDAIPMNQCVKDKLVSMHNDEFPHGTEPDFFDFMVRGEPLEEDTVYLEIENVPPAMSSEVDFFLNGIFKTDEVDV